MEKRRRDGREISQAMFVVMALTLVRYCFPRGLVERGHLHTLMERDFTAGRELCGRSVALCDCELWQAPKPPGRAVH